MRNEGAENVEFNFYPPECRFNSMGYNADLFVQMFDEQCKGNDSCKFSFKLSDLPGASCTLPQATAENWQYVMLAKCSSKTI